MTPHQLMYENIKLIDRVDIICSRLTGDASTLLGRTFLRKPDLDPPVLGFMSSISWFYVVYYETGRVNVKFLSDKLTAFGLNPDNRHISHYRVVRQFRTYFQHNLDPTEPQDGGIMSGCEGWFRERCGVDAPEEDAQWVTCLTTLLEENRDFLSALEECARKIDGDAGRDAILGDWLFRRRRFLAPHEFDPLIQEVAHDMGRNIAAAQLRKKYYGRWVDEIKLIPPDSDFREELRKLIEYAILTETTRVLPITGRDIIQKLGIPPGPKVGEFLERAKIIFETSPLSANELLDRLRQP